MATEAQVRRAKDPQKMREYERAYRKANPDKIKEKREKYKERNTEAYFAYHRARYKRTPSKHHGYSYFEILEIVKKQGGCKICKVKKPRGKARWHGDHCHKTGKFRAVLCGPCNMGLGHFSDNPKLLSAAARYLRSKF